MRYKTIAVLIAIAALIVSGGIALAAGPPPMASLYSGDVAVAGAPAVDGTEITVMIGDWEYPGTAMVSDGSYEIMAGPMESEYIGQAVTFYVNGMPATTTPAEVTFVPDDELTVDLSASSVEVTYSGTVTVAGVAAEDGADVAAEIGTLEFTTTVSAGSYELTVSPGSRTYLGETVSFYVDTMSAD